jgi:hypothetical protein
MTHLRQERAKRDAPVRVSSHPLSFRAFDTRKLMNRFFDLAVLRAL